MVDIEGREMRNSVRKELRTQIEFIVNADVISAQSLNISETGLRFDMKEPIKIHLRMEIDGELCDRDAQFVWAVKKPDGGMTYGLEFITVPEEHMF